jgi:hypothetical protein
MVTSPFGELVCFATLAAGEVSVGHRKVVGVSQWRCRQGALLQCTCYLVWDPLPLLDVLRLPTRRRQEAARRLALGAVGTAALTGTPPTRTAAGGVGQVEQALIDHLPGNGWAVHRDDRPGTSPA